MSAYYNEHDPFAAQWLRELITDGHIAPGEVDERDIQTIDPDDLRGFTQCHFFAGIGGWSLALRLAGWPDDRPVWTGSCPCQPFSNAGKRKGGADDRHLWPYWARLIGECRPPVILGEQVESAITHGWLDAVFDDLEGWAYACGAAVLSAASVGAFHIRQRLWFVAESEHTERRAVGVLDGCDGPDSGRAEAHREPGTRGEVRGLADAGCEGAARHAGEDGGTWDDAGAELHRGGEAGGLGDGASGGRRERGGTTQPGRGGYADGAESIGGLGDGDDQRLEGWGISRERAGEQPARTAGASGWANPIWHPCRDGKARPIPAERALFPLVDGVQPGRVGMLRGAGNAIVPQVAAAFIGAYLDVVEAR